jgi:hypothetical protein
MLPTRRGDRQLARAPEPVTDGVVRLTTPPAPA